MMKCGALVYLDDGKVSIYNQYLKAYYVKNLSDIPRPEEVFIIYPMRLTYTIHGGIRYQIVNRASKCVKRLHAVLARAPVPESEIAKHIVPDIPSAKYQISEKDLSKLERAIQWREMRKPVTEMLEFLEKEQRNAKYNKVNLTHIANVSPSTYLVELQKHFAGFIDITDDFTIKQFREAVDKVDKEFYFYRISTTAEKFNRIKNGEAVPFWHQPQECEPITMQMVNFIALIKTH